MSHPELTREHVEYLSNHYARGGSYIADLSVALLAAWEERDGLRAAVVAWTQAHHAVQEKTARLAPMPEQAFRDAMQPEYRALHEAEVGLSAALAGEGEK